jgi:hypothetical protein
MPQRPTAGRRLFSRTAVRSNMPKMDTAAGGNVHGPITCRACFEDRDPAVTAIESGGFRLVNDPGYGGAPDPVVLVLGQSKGRTQ